MRFGTKLEGMGPSPEKKFQGHKSKDSGSRAVFNNFGNCKKKGAERYNMRAGITAKIVKKIQDHALKFWMSNFCYSLGIVKILGHPKKPRIVVVIKKNSAGRFQCS